MIALLGDLVSIDSGSRDRDGVDRVGDRIIAFLKDEGVETRSVADTAYGCILSSRSGPDTERPFLLLAIATRCFEPASRHAGRLRFVGSVLLGQASPI